MNPSSTHRSMATMAFLTFAVLCLSPEVAAEMESSSIASKDDSVRLRLRRKLAPVDGSGQRDGSGRRDGLGRAGDLVPTDGLVPAGRAGDLVPTDGLTRANGGLTRANGNAKTVQKSYKIVSTGSETVFVPSPLGQGLVGSKIMINGDVYSDSQVTTGDNAIIGAVPAATEGSMFNQMCTCTKGENTIEENICEFSLCFADRGCLYLRSGGLYPFDPFSTDPEDVPIVTAAIVGGTGKSAGMFGEVRIQTLVRSNAAGNDKAVLQLDMIYQKNKKKNIPKFS